MAHSEVNNLEPTCSNHTVCIAYSYTKNSHCDYCPFSVYYPGAKEASRVRRLLFRERGRPATRMWPAHWGDFETAPPAIHQYIIDRILLFALS